jgi:hypothetical protein
MKTRLKAMTKAERDRIGLIKSEIGCMACRQLDRDPTPCHAHHMLDTGSRISHSHTYGLCEAHHVGNDMSVHKTKRKFAERFGTDEELLAATNGLLEQLRIVR